MNIIYTFSNMGLGDNLRGLINLLQILKKDFNKKINLYVDLSKCSISQFVIHKLPIEFSKLYNIPHKLFSYNDENSHDDEIIQYILNTNHPIVTINSNNYPDVNNITQDIKDYIKTLFIFTPGFEQLFNQRVNMIPPDYDIYHYRFDDIIFYNDPNKDYSNIINSFNNKENCLLISTSLNLKKQIYEKYNNNNIFVFLNKPEHTQKTTDENLIHIYIDFFLVTKAKHIYSYCDYRWISNFILWSSYIYDIPLNRISI